MPEPRAWTRFRKSWFIKRHFENWKEIVERSEAGENPESWVVRDGPTIYTAGEPTGLVKEVFVRQVYSPPFCRVEPEDVVVDIGANIGIFSMFAALQGATKVHSYEPSSETVSYLRKNAEANHLHQIVPHWGAVSDRTGTLRLFLTRGHCSGSNRVFDIDLREGDTAEEVPAFTLEQVLDENGLETVDFMKIDCEGAEGLIVPSTPAACFQRVKKLAMEFHDQMSPVRHEELQRQLEATGFTTRLGWDQKDTMGYIYAWR